MGDRAATTATPTGWESYLAAGERVLWQGRPTAIFDLAVVMRPDRRGGFVPLFIALVWTLTAFVLVSRGENSGPLAYAVPLFGLVPLALALRQLAGPEIAQWRHLRHAVYTLTTAQVFIASREGRARTLSRFALDQITPVFDAGPPAAIWFATAPSGARLGFAALKEAPEVYRLMLAARAAPQTHAQPPSGERI